MIFCVEDDENIRKLIVYTLESTGFEAKGFEEGQSFLNALETEIPDLIILDIMLPGMDGMEILSKLKQSEKMKDIPVVMATAKGAEYDKVKGLDAGADDYITKPFGMLELVARVKAVLRRSQKSEAVNNNVIEIKGISINLNKHEVQAGGETVLLTLKEYELLKRLLQNPDIVLTRDTLLEEIWGYEFAGETRTVDVHIRTLRQKLGEYGNRIETVRGVGYRISR
jgi:two-component system alkaline phosphatase synthesis response regulator PhoP